MKREIELTKGNAFKNLTLFALPFFIASFLQALYGATDMLVIGQFVNNVGALNAVNNASQVTQLIGTIIIALCVGTTITIGHCIGSNDHIKANKTVKSSFIMYGGFSLVLVPIIYFCSPYLLTALHINANALEYANTYLKICAFGIPFVTIYNVSAAILRGRGDSKTPMIIVLITAIINIGLDLLLTGVLKMETAGVAIATIFSQLVSAIISILFLFKYKIIHKPSSLKIDHNQSRAILKLSIPLALQETLISLSFVLITVVANYRDNSLVDAAAVGVVERVIMFSFLIPSAMLSSVSSITSQCKGANTLKRAQRTAQYAFLIMLGFGIIMSAISWNFPEVFASIFTKDEAVIESASKYMKTYALDCVLVAFPFAVNGYLCGIDKANITFIHQLCSVIIRVGAVYLLSVADQSSMFLMGLGSPCGTVFSILFLLVVLFIRRNNKSIDQVQ